MQRRKIPYSLGAKSLERLQGVDPRLQALVHEVLYYFDVSVVEGLRSEQTQREYVKAGVSKTMNSKHLKGLAVDLYPFPIPRTARGDIDSNSEAWNKMAWVVGYCAGKLGLEVTWGGTWKTLIDKPHFELES